jgi:hypothetical protein
VDELGRAKATSASLYPDAADGIHDRDVISTIDACVPEGPLKIALLFEEPKGLPDLGCSFRKGPPRALALLSRPLVVVALIGPQSTETERRRAELQQVG